MEKTEDHLYNEWIVCWLTGDLAEAARVPNVCVAEPMALERDIRALLRPANLGGIALAFGAAGLAHGLDDEFSGRVDNAALEPVLDFGNFYFGTRYSVGSVVGVWGLSKVAGLEEVHAASGEVLRALVGPLKLVAGRTRPDGSNDHSFPSGHSANAFAISTVPVARGAGGGANSGVWRHEIAADKLVLLTEYTGVGYVKNETNG